MTGAQFGITSLSWLAWTSESVWLSVALRERRERVAASETRGAGLYQTLLPLLWTVDYTNALKLNKNSILLHFCFIALCVMFLSKTPACSIHTWSILDSILVRPTTLKDLILYIMNFIQDVTLTKINWAWEKKLEKLLQAALERIIGISFVCLYLSLMKFQGSFIVPITQHKDL